jgi:hypothetical protein
LAAQGHFPEAQAQAQLLLEKDPGNAVGRLIRALAQIHGGNAAEFPNAEKELQDLLALNPLILEARRGLRQAALLRKDLARANELSTSIVADPMARFDDWLTQAEILLRQQPDHLPELLTELTTHAETNPQSLALIAGWLRKNGQSARIAPWVNGCKALQANPIIAQMILADTLMEQKFWLQLSTLLKPLKWDQLDFHRLALLARALREQHEGFSDAWNAATAAALESPSSTNQLAETITSWPGWQDEAEDFLWQAEKKDPKNLRWALTTLGAQYQNRKNTRGLLRVSEELYRTFPSSEPIQNNLAFYSLLLNTFVERAFRISNELYVAHSQAPEIVSTYSLALIRKNDFKKALQVLAQLPAERLSRNDIAPYYAAALAGNGRAGEAHELRERINQTNLLPEERELLKFE